MTDKNLRGADLNKIYTLLLSLKEEVSRLTVQVKSLRNEVKGVNDGG